MFHNPSIKANYPFLGRGFGKSRESSRYVFFDDLFDEKIIAWYQGRSEIGARALGHRSFLGLASSLKLKKHLNEYVKGREPYRPVAPIIVADYVKDFFETDTSSPFMTFSPKAKKITKELAPAILHSDFTSRIQSLRKSDNPIMYEILMRIMQETGAPIIMNTSFNVCGEPIVDTPGDAIRSFRNSLADVLYINGKRYIQS